MISSLGFLTLWEFKSYILIAFFKPGRGLRSPKSLCKNIHVGTLAFYFYAKNGLKLQKKS
uniref:Uncharacterized protein n=1 Tax=Leptospira santarosai serovar Arenal str. MAVJ 401 TaxID=1049976 RepID=M6JJS3_9LEPT|nr:hypothetical protein LEP1GSC063_2192 [Leptospira santarosai serovar Arenal str. MAVJ 401]